MQQFYNNVQRQKKMFWISTMTMIFLIGSFMFPVNNSIQKIDQLILFMVFILMSGFVFNALVPNKPSSVFIWCLVFTGLGIALRYAFEFGNSSNVLLFTSLNLTVSLIALPLFTTLTYLVVKRFF